MKTNVKNCIIDLVKASVVVLKKYSRDCRTTAWKDLTNKHGDKEMKKILNDPSRNVNTFATLNFKEWFLDN